MVVGSDTKLHHGILQNQILNLCQMEVHIAFHTASFSVFLFELLEWSEQLRPVTSVWLVTTCHTVQIWL